MAISGTVHFGIPKLTGGLRVNAIASSSVIICLLTMWTSALGRLGAYAGPILEAATGHKRTLSTKKNDGPEGPPRLI